MKHRDLIFILLINTLLLGLLALSDNGMGGAIVNWMRLLVGAFYLFFIPGYAVLAGLAPRSIQLSWLDRIALSAGLSVAVTPILGLILDGPPGGIWLWTSALGLTVITVAFTALAFVRRYFAPNDASAEGGMNFSQWWQAQGRLSRWGMALGTLAILVVSILSVAAMVLPHSDEYFTEFYVVNANGIAETYPVRVRPGETIVLRVGAVSHEVATATYAVYATYNGTTIASAPAFALVPGQAQDVTLSFALPAGMNQRVDIWLARDGEMAYRQLYLWVDVTE